MTLDEAKCLIRFRNTALREFERQDEKLRDVDAALQTAAFIDEYALREEFARVPKDCRIEVDFGFEWPSEGGLLVYAPNVKHGTYDDLNSSNMIFLYWDDDAPTVEEVGKILNDPR